MTPRFRLTSPRTATDAQLARRAAAGDDDAYAALYARYQPRLEAYCRAIVRNDEDAGDAVQNAMTKALVALRRDAVAITNVQAWLFRIAHNESISVLRRRRPTSELAEDVGPPAADPAGDVLVREELTALLAGVRELPGRLRRPLLLRELAGMSYGQVAELLGGTPASARKAVFDARAALSADREGRDEACSVIRQSLSEGDYRRRRARIVRGHLRVCGACRQWEHELSARRRQVAAAVPAGAAGGSLWAWLTGLVGSGSSAAVGVVSNTKIAAAVVAIAAGATVPVVAEHERAAGEVAAVASPPAQRSRTTSGAASAARLRRSSVAAVAARAAAPAGVAAPRPRPATTVKPAPSAKRAAPADRGLASAPDRTTDDRATTAPDAAPPRTDRPAAGAWASPHPASQQQPSQWAMAARVPSASQPAAGATFPAPVRPGPDQTMPMQTGTIGPADVG
jgi:RNA polymerase sigma factor (sigma-70 family)